MNTTLRRCLCLLSVALVSACQTTSESPSARGGTSSPSPVAVKASGPPLTGAEFKKLVIGNTLQFSGRNRRTGGQMDLRFYFVDEKTVHSTSARSSPPADESWSVTEDGKFCRVASRSGRTICGSEFRLQEDRLHGKSSRGRDFFYTLLKGKHTYRQWSR